MLPLSKEQLERFTAYGFNPKAIAKLTEEELGVLVTGMMDKLRRKQRRSFRQFVKYVDIPGVPHDKVLAEHHELMAQVLQAVADGKLKRVMFFLPPGSAKSSYASVAFPAYYMGLFPEKNVMVLSYGSDLARKFGRRCRQLVQSKKYFDVFETTVKRGVSAVDEWQLDNESEFMAAGLLAGVTGNRADGLIIDDPVRGQKDADSPAFSTSSFEAFNSDATTRLKPGGFIFIIQTRWSLTDLSGMLLPANYDGRTGFVTCNDGHDWFVVNIPMEAYRADDPLGRKPGELLWTKKADGKGWFDPGDMLKIKSAPHMQRVWAALYQQRPSLDEGLYFHRDWFQFYDEEPRNLRNYGASDYAITANNGDWTVHVAAGVDPNGDIYVTDLWRQRVTSDVSVDVWLDMVSQNEPMAWAVDNDTIQIALGPFIERRMRERNTYCYIEKLPLGRQDKAMRCRSFQARAAQKKVFLPRNKPWVADLMAELMLFPAGKTDDQVDALGLLGRLLDTMIDAHEPTPEDFDGSDDYASAQGLDQDRGDDWKVV